MDKSYLEALRLISNCILAHEMGDKCDKEFWPGVQKWLDEHLEVFATNDKEDKIVQKMYEKFVEEFDIKEALQKLVDPSDPYGFVPVVYPNKQSKKDKK